MLNFAESKMITP